MTLNSPVTTGTDTQSGGMNALSALLAKGGKGKSTEQIKAQAKDFESFFISQMLQPMFGESAKDTLTSAPETDEVYQNMMVDEYGKIIARSGGIGVADYVTRTLLQTQEVQS